MVDWMLLAAAGSGSQQRSDAPDGAWMERRLGAPSPSPPVMDFLFRHVIIILDLINTLNMSTPGADACPVDHETRQAWLDHAKKAKTQDTPAPPPQATPSPPVPTNTPHDLRQVPIQTRYSLDHGAWLAILPKNMAMMSPAQRGALDTFREISTIPRALSAEGHDAAVSTHSPANNEQESGVDEKSGNWVYPSEEMFFNAMKRKNYDPDAADMRTIVPIHNAVNEQAWKEIKAWEKGRGSEA